MNAIAWSIIGAGAMIASAMHAARGGTGAAIADSIIFVIAAFMLYESRMK